MPVVKKLPVGTLTLDPKNFRHMPQRTEEKALHAMVALKTEYFWALARRILKNGYIEIENIVVLKAKDDDGHLVKEGNRRVAIVKLGLGLLKGRDLEIPQDVADKLSALDETWRTNNSEVPCLIFPASEEAAADEIVDLTHGKGEKAGRLDWNAVATARHNRARGSNEQALDLLESYIRQGKNLSEDEKEQWAADYPLTILHNALNVLDTRLGMKSPRELVDTYPKLPQYRSALDDIMRDIGREKISTDRVRDPNFAVDYGIPLLTPPANAPAAGTGTTPGAAMTTTLAVTVPTGTAPAKKVKAVASNTQTSVRRALRKFEPAGPSRDKIVTLKIEASKLSLEDHPHSFCFILRTLFELSAKAYCADHKGSGGPKYRDISGADRPLIDVLDEIYKHMVAAKAAASATRKPDKGWVRDLHGAMTELKRSNSLFSITSLNQLVHSTTFTMTESHICSVFTNVFPMLEEMNK